MSETQLDFVTLKLRIISNIYVFNILARIIAHGYLNG